MNHTSTIFCLERRIGIERRRYSYDSHNSDRRAEKRHRGAMDRRSEDWIDPSQMTGRIFQNNDRPSQNQDC